MTSQALVTIPVAGSGILSPWVLLSTAATGAITGVTFGTFETGASVADQHGVRVMRYRGYQTWVLVQGDTIYRTTDAGATYSVVYGPDADLGTTVVKNALELVYPVGIPSQATLMIVGYDGAGGYSMFTSTDGVAWSKSAKYALTAQTMALQASTVWRGSVYCTAGLGFSATTYIADYTQQIIRQIAQPDVNGTQNDSSFCVFDDRLFGLWTRSTGDVGLYELVNGAWIQQIASLGLVSTFAADRKITLWVDGAFMYALFMRDNPNFPIPDPVPLLWTCIQISSALATSDVTAATVAVIHGGEVNTARVASVADGPAGGSGTIPEIDLYFSADGVPASAMAMWKWNGPLSAITFFGGGGLSAQNSYPLGNQYNGNVFWAAGQRAIEYVSASPVIGGVRWSFLLYSPNPSVDSVSVRGFQGTAVDEYPCGQISPNPNPVLSNPQPVGTLFGQTIIGLDAADNGATTFTVDWLALTNGGFPFAVGDYGKIVLEVF